MDQFARTRLLLGDEAMEKLKGSRVAIFGVGGVGGYSVEALARSGVGAIDITDDDRVCLTNINRQITADMKSIGKYKVDVVQERILSINPECKVTTHKCFYLPENASNFDFSKYDYVIDAVDTVAAKINLVMQANESNTNIISSMGAGNKLDPTAFMVSDIYETSVCPLARVMRRELKKRNIKSLKVVYSKEEPLAPIENISGIMEKEDFSGVIHGAKRVTPGSVAFVPSVVGLIIASEVVKDIISTISGK